MQTALPMTSGLTAADKQKLWAAADKLRGHLSAAEHRHVVLGLIFLKYISDAFEEHHATLDAQFAESAELESAIRANLSALGLAPREGTHS